MSHDEGETGNGNLFLPGSCFSGASSIFSAAGRTDALGDRCELEDEYELCYGSESFWKKKQKDFGLECRCRYSHGAFE